MVPLRNRDESMLSEKTRRIVSFVAAASNSGKTTLIEKVVPILKARGLRVAVVKHASAGFHLDKPGKDSWRFQQAGADAVILVGPGKLVLMKKTEHDLSPAELDQLTWDADIVILEGFKKDGQNQIEVFRQGVSGERPLCLDNPSYRALVSDRPFDISIPWFDINDAEGVAQFLIKMTAEGGHAAV
jgi:molybdopterin-guanine dinucleotide biosynthesis protein B